MSVVYITINGALQFIINQMTQKTKYPLEVSQSLLYANTTQNPVFFN